MSELTVILCCYNHGSYLKKQLDAICKQIEWVAEVILLDDGSQDDSYDIMKQYASMHDSIRLIKNEENKGLFFSMNYASLLVRSNYVIYLAADDVIAVGLFEKTLREFDKHPNAGFSCTDIVELYEPSNLLKKRTLGYSTTAKYIDPDACFRLARKQKFNLVNCQTVVYKTEYLRKFGFFNEDLGMWTDILPLWVFGLKYGFIYIPEVLGTATIHGSNWSGVQLRDIKKLHRCGRSVLNHLPIRDNELEAIRKSTLLSRVKGLVCTMVSDRKKWKYLCCETIFLGFAREVLFYYRRWKNT